MRPIIAPAAHFHALLFLFGLAACGGGGGGDNRGPSISVSRSSLSFSAATPSAAAPASQTVTLTVNGTITGTLFVRVVVTGPAVGYKLGSGNTSLFLYSASQAAFSTPGVSGGFNTFSYALAGTASNGATVAIIESGLTSATPFYRYVASSGILSRTTFQLDHHNPDLNQNINAPAFDRAGSRMVVASFGPFGIGPTYGVYDANFARLGSLPSSTTAAYAVAPDASRVYTLDLDTGVCRVRAFDLIATPGTTALLTEIVASFPITISDCPAGTSTNNVKMLVSPAGDTLFIAGNVRIAVVPLP